MDFVSSQQKVLLFFNSCLLLYVYIIQPKSLFVKFLATKKARKDRA